MLTTIIVVTIVSIILALSIFFASGPFEPLEPWERRLLPPREIPGDIEFYYIAQTVVSTINVTLSVFLLLTYISVYVRTRSEFTIGLIIFSAVFLLDAIASNPLVTLAFGFRAFGLGPFALLPDMFTLAALIVLLYLSVKY
jgi:hypothetical protein